MTEPTTHDLLDGLRRALAGRYDVERLLGAGGMGSVYLGRDVTLDRPVAIKVIAPELAAASVLRERFLREARTVARLRHPNIVAVHAAGEAEGMLWFVMEYVDGESLRDRSVREGAAVTPAAIAEQVRVLRDLARALGYAHAQGIIHRDVKPENVLLRRDAGDEEATALLTDFGVARALEPVDGRMTGTGMVLGSPRYMSPEQASGERALDGRSDVYSLGLVAYELFVGEPAVTASTVASIMVKQLTETPIPLAERNPAVPASVSAAIDRALAKSPDERWESAYAFADALDAALADDVDTVSAPGLSRGGPPPNTRMGARTGSGVTRRPPAGAAARVAGSRRRFAIGGAVLGALALAAGAWVAVERNDGPSAAERRKSYLVAPFEVQSADPQLAWLRDASVSMLSLDLAQWSDLDVVDYERGLDLLRDLDLDGARRLTLEDARRLARRAGVWTVVMGQVRGTADSLHVVASLYDVATGRKVDEAQSSVARAADPRGAFHTLARGLLDLAGAPRQLSSDLASATSSSLEAYRVYLEGVRALNAWQLGRADSLLDRASTIDTTFALAYYQRALTLGWTALNDSGQQTAIRRAQAHADRLPPRERALLAAFADLAAALRAQMADDTLRANPLFVEAQRKYLGIIAKDSGDAEAWYGLGDAYYHHFVDGWAKGATLVNWTKALHAFNRTLAVDSSFHLAYAHKLNIYQAAAVRESPVVLEGDSLRVLSEAEQRNFTAPRVQQAKRAAQLLVTREARNWANVDPVPRAYVTLADAWSAAGRNDSAAAALAEGAARPEHRGGSLPFMHALALTRTAPESAAAALHAALRAASLDQLRAERESETWRGVIVGGTAAALGGRIADLDSTVALAARVQPVVPLMNVQLGRHGQAWASAAKLAMGLPAAPQRASIDAELAQVEAMPRSSKEMVTYMSYQVPYVAYAITRDPRYAATARRWWGTQGTPLTELDALEAISRGDLTQAAQLARTFPAVDTVRAGPGSLAAMRWLVRAEVQQALGNTRDALAYYELLEPERFSRNRGGLVDAAYPLWVRSFVARARLYESLGQREQAARSYARFIELWKDADAPLQPQVRAARAALARLRDAAPGTEVKGGAGD